MEKDLAGKATILRLDILTPVGRETALHFGVRGTPTVVLLAGDGSLLLSQVGIIRPSPIKEAIGKLLDE